METPTKKKSFWMAPFVVHATRGLLRDQATRRKTMFGTIVLALVFMVVGSTFLESLLDPHQHPGWFIGFWFACAWLTILALLLALFDVLLVRAQGRAARKAFREHLPESPGRETKNNS